MALCGGCAAPRPEHVSPNGGGSGKPGLHFGDVTPQKSAPQEARHLQSGQLIGLPNREREILVWPVKPFKGYRTWIMRTTVRCSWVSIRLHEPKLRCPPWFELLTIGLASFLDRIIPSCISFLSHPHTNLVQLISNPFLTDLLLFRRSKSTNLCEASWPPDGFSPGFKLSESRVLRRGLHETVRETLLSRAFTGLCLGGCHAGRCEENEQAFGTKTSQGVLMCHVLTKGEGTAKTGGSGITCFQPKSYASKA